jgi:hypothetical protein
VWQQRLLPLMVKMVVGLTVFFFLATLVQLFYLHLTIRNGPRIVTSEALQLLVPVGQQDPKVSLLDSELRRDFLLEVYIANKRYHQGNVLLMSRVWTRYLGFSAGMILAMVGAVFILGKLRAPESEIDAGAEGIKLVIKSASPGIILAAFGVILMGATIVTRHEINISDKRLYAKGIGEVREEQGAPTDELLEQPKERTRP